MNEQTIEQQIPALSAELVRRLRGGTPVLLCIGSDRVLLDCFGPLVGSLLTSKYALPAYVYGTLSHPVNALNLRAALEHIGRRHPGKTVLALDSSLGKPCDIGRLSVVPGGIRAGAAFQKNLPLAGDIGLTATVAAISAAKTSAVRLGLVARLADAAAGAVYRAVTTLAQSDCSRTATI